MTGIATAIRPDADPATRFGAYCAERRRTLRCDLREFCLKNDFEPSEISKVERAVAPPPTGALLARYALALGILDGTPEHRGFIELAGLSRAHFPRPPASDIEILGRLPVILPRDVSDERLDRLVEVVRDA